MALGMHRVKHKSDTLSALDKRSIAEVPEVASAVKKVGLYVTGICLIIISK